jgi:hypothetical protein
MKCSKCTTVIFRVFLIFNVEINLMQNNIYFIYRYPLYVYADRNLYGEKGGGGETDRERRKNTTFSVS